MSSTNIFMELTKHNIIVYDYCSKTESVPPLPDNVSRFIAKVDSRNGNIMGLSDIEFLGGCRRDLTKSFRINVRNSIYESDWMVTEGGEMYRLIELFVTEEEARKSMPEYFL